MLLYVDLVGHVVITRHQLDPLAIHVWGIDGCMPPSMPPKKWYVAYIWYFGCFGHPVLLLHVCPNASSNPYAHTHTHSYTYITDIPNFYITYCYISRIFKYNHIYMFVNIICMCIYRYMNIGICLPWFIYICMQNTPLIYSLITKTPKGISIRYRIRFHTNPTTFVFFFIAKWKTWYSPCALVQLHRPQVSRFRRLYRAAGSSRRKKIDDLKNRLNGFVVPCLNGPVK